MHQSFSLRGARHSRILALVVACTAILFASCSNCPCSSGGTKAEQLAEKNLEVARKNPVALRHFLLGMPKGADLHNHLSGAVYAESWIRAAAEDHLMVDRLALAFVQPKDVTKKMALQLLPDEKPRYVPAESAYKDQHLFDALVNSFSMRSFVPSPGVSGHDHFFDTFGKFKGTDDRHIGEWVDEVATRAAAQNEQYLELMQTPYSVRGAALVGKLKWQSNLEDDYAQLPDDERKLATDEGLKQLDDIDALRQSREHCGKPDASLACQVQVRYIYQVGRGRPKEEVFVRAVLGFETAQRNKSVVGLNFVMPEDGYISMTDYALHMQMVKFLHGKYPGVHVTLHAGELAPGLVSPEDLCCHIRLAVEEAGAERIGHGVDIMYEDHPHELLKKMAAAHVMVEINLSSNDGILGITGKDHPFPVYRQFGVPVALSTDDEGVSRIDLTHEYVRAVQTYDLHYADLKKMARTGLEHSFLPGDSLWKERDNFTNSVADCASDSLGAEKPSQPCAGFLKKNERARQQWELERRFVAFEASL